MLTCNFERKKEMKTRTLITLLATCGIVMISAGCSTDMARTNYDNKIVSAYGQIQQQRYDSAIKRLKEAEKIAEENSYDNTEAVRFMVEAYLGTGDTIEAYNHAKELLDKNDEDPFALELMGKVCLKDGARYVDAEKYFVDAQSGYEQEKDIARVTDLISLTRGLTEYQNGNPRLASRYFKEIENVELQYAVNEMQKDFSLNK